MNANTQTEIVKAIARISNRAIESIVNDTEIQNYSARVAVLVGSHETSLINELAHKAVHEIVAEKPYVGAGCECVTCGKKVY